MIILIKILCVYLLIVLGMLFLHTFNKDTHDKLPTISTTFFYIIPEMIVLIYTLTKIWTK